MDKDWTFLAHDRRTGRQQTIDRRWQSWGPATDPIHEYDGYFAGDDERLYRTPDGDYVLVWRADQLRQYYECDYMPVAEAKAWFARQDGLSGNPFAAQVQSAPTLDYRSYRSLWDFGRKVEEALERVMCAACNLCCDEFGMERDADADDLRIKAAVAELGAVIRVISNVDDWINTPNGADELVNTLFGIQRETRSLVIKIGHSLKPLTWKGDFKKLSLLQDFLKREIASLASIPELESELHAEALPKLQAPAPATAAADGTAPQAGDFVETPGGDIGIIEWAAYPMPATDQAEPPSKTPPVEALASEAATVQAAAVEPPSMSTSGSSKPTSKWAGGPRNVTGTREGGDLQIIGARRPLGDSEQPTAVEAPPPDETMLPEDREKLDALFGLALTAKGPKDYNALATTFLEDHNEQLRVDPWSMSDRKLADAIGCSESTASTLPVWKAFKYRRGPKRKRGPGKAPPVVSFTEKVDATVGKPDEQLQRLIDEGQYDPSPLDDDLPGEPRRVKLKHRKP